MSADRSRPSGLTARASRRQVLHSSAAGLLAVVGLAACGGSNQAVGPLPTLPAGAAPGASSSAATTASAAPATSAAATSSAAASTAASGTTSAASSASAAAATSAAGATVPPKAMITPTAPAAATGNEAPSLAALVKAGTLPPLEQRLPKQPAVVKPVEKTGYYGGVWHTGTTGQSDTAWMTRTMAYDNLVRWAVDWKSTEPNIALKVEASPDAKTFTFTLREGMKWSDGQPLTADDFIYTNEDVFKNTDLTPVYPSWMTSGGKPATASKKDDYTLVYTFDSPNGLFLTNMATPSGQNLATPAHYLKQFNPKYASGSNSSVQASMQQRKADIDRLMKQNGQLGNIGAFYSVMSDYTLNPDLPVLWAYKATNVLGQGTRFVVERNPFYWKTDSDGHQLPYMDAIWYDVFQDSSTMVLRALAGDFDYHDRHFNNNQNKSVLYSGQQKGDFHLTTEIPDSTNTAVISLNLTHKDPVLRKVFQDKRFRIALSYAINRKDAINIAYVNQGEPAQPAPLKQTKYYDEAYTTQYTQYDPKQANSLLDEMGLTKKDSSGMRLRPDGKPLLIAVEVVTALQPEWTDYLQLVKKYWAAVGVNMVLKEEERSIFYARKLANEHDAGVWGGDGGLSLPLEMRWYFPFSNESIYAVPWALWFQSNGKTGEEPPADTKKQMDLYNQVVQTGDPAKQDDLIKQILAISKDQFYCIGLSSPINGYGIQRNDFHNVTQTMFGAWLWPTPGPDHPEQFFTTRTS